MHTITYQNETLKFKLRIYFQLIEIKELKNKFVS